ncbi:MAG: hypothetical protein B7Z73_10685 [Planctomycetia bacterium 21-64-5]|nr:MAG: hypothetical protein B7Z73_10685 [Planctomycetia bacterium 21-64-5]HQU46022.1 hypothetical protein [Pirellulales bacterium]
MATVSRFDLGQFNLSHSSYPGSQAQPVRRSTVAANQAVDGLTSPAVHARATPLDERLQPCGSPFECDALRSTVDSVTLWHIRPVRTRFLAVELPVGASVERLVVRVTRCESFGFDFAVRGDVMGS